MPTPFQYPRFAFGSRQTRAFQMMNSEGYFLGKSPRNPQAQQLKRNLRTLQALTERILPTGCPFVIGGGLARDALGGARPDDIDIWLPSNISEFVQDCNAFQWFFENNIPVTGSTAQIVFRGPGARGTLDLEASLNAVAYSDVNNHWVAECALPGYPKVNFMRTMVPWTGDTQAFFNTVMRSFDLDICMMFLAFEPGVYDTKYIVMPLHVVDACESKRGTTPTLNMIYWNRARMEQTSATRTNGRIEKMNRKYQFGLRLETIQLIETDQIVACPVKISKAVRWADMIYAMPQPSYQEFANAS